MGNVLYYGDNLDVLRRHVPDESVDLVYLDPPFNSNANYNVLFGHADGTQAAAQIKAFDDTWHWDNTAAAAFHEVVTNGGQVAEALAAFQTLLGPSTMLAYLAMMAPRLVELHRTLKPTGSLYLHCDPTASHYLKLLLDATFGAENFRNEIVWKRFNFHADAHRFGRVTDRLLFYTRSSDYRFVEQRVPFSTEYVESKFTHVDDDGRRFRLSDLNPPSERGPVYEFHGVTKAWRMTQEKMLQLEAEGRIYTKSKVAQLKRYLDELDGQAVHELWDDVSPINPRAAERLGYPTQKPEALLTRIIEASCPAEGVVLDPFCGCGTAVVVAEKLNRRWIGIDLTYLAISLIKSRLTAMGSSDYTVLGEPTTADDAADLAAEDPYQFQWWALGLIGARPAEGKKGADQGIDGRLFFFDGDAKPRQVIVSVKAGKVQPSYVRDLRGVIDREQAQIGVLISFNEPTDPMKKEAASAGFYTSPWGQHPRIQLLTVAELLAGKRIDMPAGGAHMTQVALPPTPEETVHPDQLSLGG
jgi:site-specific DNA-methyltransferase (adenine-specific)